MPLKRILLAVCLLFILTFNFVSFSATESETYYNNCLKRAAATYVVVRGINSIISVAQETEISASPGGMGLTIAVGQFLDPLNDIIERFSVVILLAATSLGIQKLLLVLTTTAPLRYLVLISVFGFYLLVLFNKHLPKVGFNIIAKIFLFIIVLRFTIPLISLADHLISEHFINDLISLKTEQLQMAHAQIGQVDFSDEGSFYAKAKQSLNFPQKIDEMEEFLSKSLDNIFDLITLFISQTIVLPLLFLYLITVMTKHLFGYDLKELLPDETENRRKEN